MCYTHANLQAIRKLLVCTISIKNKTIKNKMMFDLNLMSVFKQRENFHFFKKKERKKNESHTILQAVRKFPFQTLEKKKEEKGNDV